MGPILIVVATLTGCSANASATAPAAPTGRSEHGLWTTTASASLRQDTKDACRDIWATPGDELSGRTHIIIVVDRTAGMADQPLPPLLETDIRDASSTGGKLSVIGVEGAGRAPLILVKNAALNTPGPLDRPSVKDVAEAMPACVAAELLSRDPEAEGSDIYSALAIAAELATADSKLWILSDGQFNAGPAVLTEDLLRLEPAAAASRISSTVPLNLKGQWRQAGLANTTTSLGPAAREWMRTFTSALCAEWKASGCQDIALTPVNPIRSGSGELPADEPLRYPATTVVRTTAGCTFTIPEGLTFAKDSPVLRDGAEGVLQVPVALAAGTPESVVRITAHTASVPGSRSEDLVGFSRLRGQSAANVFRAAGIPEDRLVIEGVGDTMPLAEDIDPATGEQIESLAALERRVDILVQGAQCSP
ncbi:hypothetical protein ACRB8A_20170 (plasmid) [Arthrobacter sp. G.S.26]|uniref:hypothetical protein n=1 Tax=Arthrobacter sp. G.S.26 TaxID=3433706 RepID=UPI003D770FFE